MSHTAINKPKIALALTTALASVALSGCATSAAPPSHASVAKAQVAMQKGQTSKAIQHAESAVLAEPRNAQNRALLGAAYLEAGRFQAAATSFADAMQLGDSDPRTVLSYSLAQIALGNHSEATSALWDSEQDLDPADLGLALALAGDADSGVRVLSSALRAGQSTVKVRQNLAYAYALQGNWRAARVMVAEDVPANLVSDRIGEWAEQAAPENFQSRVATLLQVDPVYDAGQPTHLALGNFPSQQQMVADAAADVDIGGAADEPQLAFADGDVELPAAETQPLVATQVAVAEPAPVATLTPAAERIQRVVSGPVVQPLPADYKPSVAKPAESKSRLANSSSQRRMAATSNSTSGNHLVQLGSFSTQASAERAWGIYQTRYPSLSGRDVVITEALVDGKTYFRVAAAGFNARAAYAMCGTVKAGGKGCIAHAQSRPLPGAVDRGIRVASR